MLESSFGLVFFLKIPRNESKIRTIYGSSAKVGD
ncbi:hypothetical protein HNQ02_000730 [Flavobacterium sp. 7E]|nr:hypothetical protein [Flavobacterium sp. 7E]